MTNPTKKTIKKYIKETITRYKNIRLEYSESYDDLMENITKEIARKEYASNGINIYRGYYCPSLIQDIVVGNLKRGKLLKRITSRSNPTYEYCFDKNDNLILVNDLKDGKVIASEFILNENDYSLGVKYVFDCFDSKPNIENISECFYDDTGKMLRYVKGFYSLYSFSEVEFEQYEYNEEGLYKAYMMDLVGGYYDYNIYIFTHNAEGYLSDYLALSAEEFCNYKNLDLDDYRYKVYVDRKV